MKWEECPDTKQGFTIVETLIYLALAGALVAGAIVGIGGSLARQRYKDSVEDFATKLRVQYDNVSRAQVYKRTTGYKNACDDLLSGDQRDARGRSDCNVYGIAITLGGEDGTLFQATTVLGQDITSLENELERTSPSSESGITQVQNMSEYELLKSLRINNVVTQDGKCRAINVLNSEKLRWGAKVELPGNEHKAARYIILVIRSPRDGTVHTYSYQLKDSEKLIDYNSELAMNCPAAITSAGAVDINTLFGRPEGEGFKIADVDLCLHSEDMLAGVKRRREIRIAANGHGSSAVELINQDESNEEIYTCGDK